MNKGKVVLSLGKTKQNETRYTQFKNSCSYSLTFFSLILNINHFHSPPYRSSVHKMKRNEGT